MGWFTKDGRSTEERKKIYQAYRKHMEPPVTMVFTEFGVRFPKGPVPNSNEAIARTMSELSLTESVVREIVNEGEKKNW